MLSLILHTSIDVSLDKIPININMLKGSRVLIWAFDILLFQVERKDLPQNKPQALTPEELARRREEAKSRHAARLAGATVDCEVKDETQSEPVEELSDDVFVAFARVYSGCLKKGRSVYVLGPKHDPATALRMVGSSAFT